MREAEGRGGEGAVDSATKTYQVFGPDPPDYRGHDGKYDHRY